MTQWSVLVTVPVNFVSRIRGSKHHGFGRGGGIYYPCSLLSTSSSNLWSTGVAHGRLYFEICGASCARVKYILDAMAKSLSEFVPTFERLTHNPEDYLRYDSNV